MPKTKIFIFLLILFFSKNLNARTIGNYVGVDIVKTALSFSSERTIYETNELQKSVQSVPNPSYSFGLKYNYALNYRGFFISPGLIYEKNTTKVILILPKTLKVPKKDMVKAILKLTKDWGQNLI
jgi:hypothetical protein